MVKKRRSGGGSRVRSLATGVWGGSLAIILGSVALVICLIAFGIAIGQLDTGITSAASYSQMTGLPNVMGVYGMIFFIAFMGLGMTGIIGGTVMNVKRSMSGGWNEIFVGAVMGAVTVIITLVVFNIAIIQLDADMTTVNSTTNYATYFTGLFSIMGVWGLVIFVAMSGAALAQIGGAGYGAYKQLRG